MSKLGIHMEMTVGLRQTIHITPRLRRSAADRHEPDGNRNPVRPWREHRRDRPLGADEGNTPLPNDLV